MESHIFVWFFREQKSDPEKWNSFQDNWRKNHPCSALGNFHFLWRRLGHKNFFFIYSILGEPFSSRNYFELINEISTSILLGISPSNVVERPESCVTDPTTAEFRQFNRLTGRWRPCPGYANRHPSFLRTGEEPKVWRQYANWAHGVEKYDTEVWISLWRNLFFFFCAMCRSSSRFWHENRPRMKMTSWNVVLALWLMSEWVGRFIGTMFATLDEEAKTFHDLRLKKKGKEKKWRHWGRIADANGTHTQALSLHA